MAQCVLQKTVHMSHMASLKSGFWDRMVGVWPHPSAPPTCTHTRLYQTLPLRRTSWQARLRKVEGEVERLQQERQQMQLQQVRGMGPNTLVNGMDEQTRVRQRLVSCKP